MLGFLRKKKTIGRLETVDFPELGLFGIEAKIDTGAYRSAIHARDIYEGETSHGKTLSFKLLDEDHPQYSNRLCTVSSFSRVSVKSSTGVPEYRYKIKTTVVIKGNSYVTDFTLADRTAMRYPVLIGRKVLRNRFIVDVSHS